MKPSIDFVRISADGRADGRVGHGLREDCDYFDVADLRDLLIYRYI